MPRRGIKWSIFELDLARLFEHTMRLWMSCVHWIIEKIFPVRTYTKQNSRFFVLSMPIFFRIIFVHHFFSRVTRRLASPIILLLSRLHTSSRRTIIITSIFKPIRRIRRYLETSPTRTMITPLQSDKRDSASFEKYLKRASIDLQRYFRPSVRQ